MVLLVLLVGMIVAGLVYGMATVGLPSQDVHDFCEQARDVSSRLLASAGTPEHSAVRSEAESLSRSAAQVAEDHAGPDGQVDSCLATISEALEATA